MSESSTGSERSSGASNAAANSGAVRRRRRPLIEIGLPFVCCLVLMAWGTPLQADEVRSALTYSELMTLDATEVDVVDNSWFVPVGESGPPLHQLEGTLTVSRAQMQRSSYEYAAYRYFPGLSVDFVEVDGHLVPSDRSIIVNPGNWSLVLSPGRAWSEPGDNGMSRASFAFTLGSPPDRLFGGGEAHNGVATFLFDDTSVSSFRFQITQETAPDGDIYDMWGQLPMEYKPVTVGDRAEIEQSFAEELATQFPVAEWSDLEMQVGTDVLNSFHCRVGSRGDQRGRGRRQRCCVSPAEPNAIR